MAESRPPDFKPVVLATGGTGGHVFPAEALAGELESRGVPFALVTDRRGRQWQGALARRPIHYIHSASPTGSLQRRLMALLSLGLGLVDAWRALGRIDPSVVIGFGGYASVPTMVAARLRRLPALLHEQNAVLGKANRLVVGGVARVGTSFAETRGLENDERARLVGNPVREPVRLLRGSPYRAPAADRVIDMLVFAGSQGAASFSQVIPTAILTLPRGLRARLRLVQQCRSEDLEHVRKVYQKAGIVAELAPFFADLAQRLAAAHLVIGRSGASTVAELAAIGRPSILVPYPYAADDHQMANARAFEATGACIVIPHAAFTAEALAGNLMALFEAPQRLAEMAAAAHGAGRPDAAHRLADLVGELIDVRALAPSGVRRMRALPLDIGLIHFVGIGGIGMSGIAEVLHNLGYKVQGSDLAEGANTRRLSDLGIKVSIGHRADNLGNAQVVVVSSAVKKDNPEVLAARARLVPVVRRAEMLGELMRLKWSVAIGGTHGKTTTTSMVASMLDAGGLDPTVINGGIINAYGTNARIGAGDWMVVESDESDGSFLRLPATIAIVTNVDPEHLDHYGTFDALRDAFVRFVENIPFYGFAVLCVDHPEVQAMIPRVADRRIITYGLGNNADVRAVNVRLDRGGANFDVQIENRATNQSRVIVDLRLPMFGQHNVQNALSAIAVANEMGLPDETIRRALANFSGVKRRFTKTGEAHGITVIDDYGHHPVEIAATLRAARQSYGGSGRVIAVMQPHRYTRLASLRDDFATCFADADSVVIADVYAAGETPMEGVNRDMLVGLVQRAGHRDVTALAAPADLPGIVWRIARPGDVVICLGAGNITAWAHALPGQLQQLAAQQGGPRAVANDHSPGGAGTAA